MKSPVAFGFQTSQSLVRLMAAMRTSLVTSSPSDERSWTVVTYSRGSELSIVNGMRTALPATPKVGSVEAEKLDVGQPGAAAHRRRRRPAPP